MPRGDGSDPAPPGIAAPEAAAAGRRVFVLKTAGVCEGYAEAVSKMLFTAGIRSQILGAEQLRAAVGPLDLIVIDGGDPDGEGEWTVKQALVKAGAFDWLKAHIAGGGRYVGICAGAYLTEKWIDRDAGEKGLHIFPGRIDNYMMDGSAHYILARWGPCAHQALGLLPGRPRDVAQAGSGHRRARGLRQGRLRGRRCLPVRQGQGRRGDYDLGIELIRRILKQPSQDLRPNPGEN